MSSGPLIALRNVTKTYESAAGGFTALSEINITIARGEFAVIVGESGCGKSTLLALVAGIDRPTQGDIHIGGEVVHTMTERALSAWRGKAIGLVFQFFQLLPTLTACENVMLPMDFCKTFPRAERRDRAMALLNKLGVADQANKLPSKLSGGQQQRVAVARALANGPTILLADEPTGNLDSRTSRALLDLLASLVSDGQTLVMVTHDRGAMSVASRCIELADGRVVADGVPAHA